MSSRFQTAVLRSSLFYPNAVAWSDENLVAVAAGANVIIMNPSNPSVRGFITVTSSDPFPVGVIDGEEGLLDGWFLAHNLSRDTRPCVRSLSWSPVGLANNAGSLISVCTAGGKVKLYRSPFCEFSTEWIEVIDISEMLHNYLKDTGFGDSDLATSEIFQEMPTQENENLDLISDPQLYSETRKRRKKTVVAKDPNKMRLKNKHEIVPASAYEDKNLKKMSDNLPSITATKYASRNAMLISLSLAWSPLMGTSEVGVTVPDTFCCSLLAVGGKCGRVSIWRVSAPKNYSIDNTKFSTQVSLAAIFKPHDAWVTAIDWAFSGPNFSNPRFVLATGGSDGSVKIWQINYKELLNSSGVIPGTVSLLQEVVSVDSAMVSILAITLQSQRPVELLLAVGKGSGSFEFWIINMDTKRSEKIVCYHAHACIVTGLAWAFDGCCLYSCSQDNSIKCWSLVENLLTEVPFPCAALEVQGFRDVHYVYESCFGLAISPGNLAMAVARRLDVDLLHPMYEGRTHRAAIEFLWIGGQQLRPFSTCNLDLNNISVPGLPQRELMCWENNIHWSLNLYKDSNRMLNIWDVVSALLALKHSAPQYLDHVLTKWLSSFIGSETGNFSTLLSESITSLPKLSTRQLQLINIISRRVVLRECKENNIIGNDGKPEGFNHTVQQAKLWSELLLRSENELLERLVCFNFSAILNLNLDSSAKFVKSGNWSPDGFTLMEQWISQNQRHVKDHSNTLAKEVGKLKKRILHDIYEWEEDECCTFCSAVVPFESKEYGICFGYNNGENKHRVERCGVSMRILPAKPSWYCMCCERRVLKFAPTILFTMERYPCDFISFVKSCDNSSTPCCLFCGILLQRSLPQYSLSSCFA